MSETAIIPKLENGILEFQKCRIEFDKRLGYNDKQLRKSTNIQAEILERLDKGRIKTYETLDQHTKQLEKLNSIDKK